MAKKSKKKKMVMQGVKAAIGIAIFGSIVAIGEAILHLESVRWDSNKEGR